MNEIHRVMAAPYDDIEWRYCSLRLTSLPQPRRSEHA